MLFIWEIDFHGRFRFFGLHHDERTVESFNLMFQYGRLNAEDFVLGYTNQKYLNSLKRHSDGLASLEELSLIDLRGR